MNDSIKTPRFRPAHAGEVLLGKEFLLIWSSGSLLWLCRWMEWFVLALLVFELTGSPFQVALVFVLYWTPMLFFSVVAGLVVDRVERWRILMAAHGGAILITAVPFLLLLTDRLELWHIFLAVLVLGFTMSFDFSARAAFVFDVVGPKKVVRAMSFEMIGLAAGSFLGPFAGGYLIELAGFEGPYVFLLGVYLTAALATGVVRSRFVRSGAIPESPIRGLVTGIRYCARHGVILGVAACTMLVNFWGYSSTPLFPVVATDYLHVEPGLAGLLSSGQGIGMLVSASALAIVGVSRNRGRLFVLTCVSWLVFLLAFGLSRWYPLSFAMLLLMGVAIGAYFPLQRTITLTSAEPEMQGRALGAVGMFIGITPLGTLMVGALAEGLGAPLAIVISAASGVVLLVPVLLFTPLARTHPAAAAARGQVGS